VANLCFLYVQMKVTKGGVQGYALVMTASGVQLVALIWYLISFLPGGAAGLSVIAKIVCSMLQPVLKVCFVLQARVVACCVQYCCRRS
jgi:hypothetical protein